MYQPEKTTQETYQGKTGLVSWREHTSWQGNKVDFHSFWPDEQLAVAYARTVIESPVDQTVTLRLGSDDGAKIWVNGKLVHSRRIYRPFVNANDRIQVTLKKGPNGVLIKIDQALADWEFALDAFDASGWPANVKWSRSAIPKAGQNTSN